MVAYSAHSMRIRGLTIVYDTTTRQLHQTVRAMLRRHCGDDPLLPHLDALSLTLVGLMEGIPSRSVLWGRSRLSNAPKLFTINSLKESDAQAAFKTRPTRYPPMWTGVEKPRIVSPRSLVASMRCDGSLRPSRSRLTQFALSIGPALDVETVQNVHAAICGDIPRSVVRMIFQFGTLPNNTYGGHPCATLRFLGPLFGPHPIRRLRSHI